MSAGASPVPANIPLVADAHAAAPTLFSLKLPKSIALPNVGICKYYITNSPPKFLCKSSAGGLIN